MMATLLATGAHLLLCVDSFLHVTPDPVDSGLSNVQNQIYITPPHFCSFVQRVRPLSLRITNLLHPLLLPHLPTPRTRTITSLRPRPHTRIPRENRLAIFILLNLPSHQRFPRAYRVTNTHKLHNRLSAQPCLASQGRIAVEPLVSDGGVSAGAEMAYFRRAQDHGQ